jgi:transmembrane sensor
MTDKLRVPIKDQLDASLDEVRVQRMWRGLQQRAAVKATPRRWIVAGALVACALLLFVLRTPDAGPLAVRGASTLTFDRARTVLSDGSQIEIAADTRLVLLENNGQSFALRLERGRARFEVTPGGPRRWRMECGLASVTVVGTALTIERGASSLRVEVAHGVVEVRGERVPDGLRRLTAGQSLSIDSPAAPGNAQPSSARAAADSQPTAAVSSTSAPALPQASAKARAAAAVDLSVGPARIPQVAVEPAARALASDRPRAELREDATSVPPVTAATASSALDPSPPHVPIQRAALPSATTTAHTPEAAAASTRSGAPPEPAGVAQDAAWLLAEADRARLDGAQGRAFAILRELLSEHSGTSEAGIAGFTLARMQMAQDPRAAARALRASLAAATPESLREDALARLVEAYARSDEHALASRTAAEYRRKYPSGRLLAEVERWAVTP